MIIQDNIPDLATVPLETVEQDLIQEIISQQVVENQRQTTRCILGLLRRHYGESEALRFEKILNNLDVCV